MDTPPPATLDTRALTETLRGEWSIDVDALEYLPKGAGSYHWRASSGYFVTVDDLDTKPWIAQDRDATFDGLTAAYATAWTLHHGEGLALAVPPLRTGDGAVVVRIDEQFTVAVFPLIDGNATEWGMQIAPDDHAVLVRELSGLHGAQAVELHRCAHELPERAELMDALDSLSYPWTDERAAYVLDRLARFDELAAFLDRGDEAAVVTHGEPHPGNLIWTDAGVRLIDWDTVALAEPERDLWMLADQHDGVRAYGRPVDAAAIEFYGLKWTLSDIASFSSMFRREQPRTKWVESKWTGFMSLLEGAPTRPYGAPSRTERT